MKKLFLLIYFLFFNLHSVEFTGNQQEARILQGEIVLRELIEDLDRTWGIDQRVLAQLTNEIPQHWQPALRSVLADFGYIY